MKSKNKPVQYLTEEYVEQTRHATPEQIIEFLEESKKLFSAKDTQIDVTGVKYQSLIKDLMRDSLRARK